MEPRPISEVDSRAIRVLIHAPFGRDGALLGSLLRDAGMEAQDFATLDLLFDAIPEGAAALLIGDEALSSAAIDRLRVILKHQPVWSDLPVFVMTRPMPTGTRDSYSHRLAGVGNVSLLDRPLRAEIVISTFQMALRARVRQYEIRDHLEAKNRSATSLAVANAELRRANEDLNQFAYSVSHDLQEPLRMVAVFTQMLQREFGRDLDPKALEYMAFAVQGAKRMEELLKDLLSYVQAVNQAQEGPEQANATLVFRQALENLEEAIRDTHADIRCGDLPLVGIRPVHLLQILQNVIGNAIKYRGDARPEIFVSADHRDGEWIFNVRDNGIGVDAQFSQQIFGLFKRLHREDKKYSGTGIGLAICQKIVERYGGRIWVESDGAGKGSLFRFTVPAAPAGAPQGDDRRG